MNCLDRVSKKTQISNFMTIRSMGAELFREDRRTDMTKLIVAFRNFANTSKRRINGQDRFVDEFEGLVHRRGEGV